MVAVSSKVRSPSSIFLEHRSRQLENIKAAKRTLGLQLPPDHLPAQYLLTSGSHRPRRCVSSP